MIRRTALAAMTKQHLTRILKKKYANVVDKYTVN